MERELLIPADEFCTHYNIEFSFIHALEEYGLIHITTIEERGFIPNEQLKELEQYIRMHFDLGINLEGIDAINNMLVKVKELQHELIDLRNKLQAFENEKGRLNYSE